jgi:hypothetical protein
MGAACSKYERWEIHTKFKSENLKGRDLSGDHGVWYNLSASILRVKIETARSCEKLAYYHINENRLGSCRVYNSDVWVVGSQRHVHDNSRPMSLWTTCNWHLGEDLGSGSSSLVSDRPEHNELQYIMSVWQAGDMTCSKQYFFTSYWA